VIFMRQLLSAEEVSAFFRAPSAPGCIESTVPADNAHLQKSPSSRIGRFLEGHDGHGGHDGTVSGQQDRFPKRRGTGPSSLRSTGGASRNSRLFRRQMLPRVDGSVHLTCAGRWR
jgi:hypothetical protein